MKKNTSTLSDIQQEKYKFIVENLIFNQNRHINMKQKIICIVCMDTTTCAAKL